MNNEIDIVAIQQAAEDAVRAEYDSAFARLERQRSGLVKEKAQWASIVAQVNDIMVRSDEIDEADVLDANSLLTYLEQTIAEAFKVKKLIEAINSNELLKSQWDRLVMSIRLTGGDSK